MGFRRTSVLTQAEPRARAQSRTLVLIPELEDLICAFDPNYKTSVRRLLYSSPRVADLARVFPAALHVIASRQAPQSRRKRALDLVEKGAQLKDVANALQLPLWMRRLPAGAFRGPLPPLASGDGFSRRIVNHLPRPGSDAAFWLRSVSFAQQAADDAFALWLAQQPLFRDDGDPQRLFGLLAAYSWFSAHEKTRANSLISVRWRPEIALETAVCSAKSWLNRLRLIMQLSEGVIADPWLVPSEVDGFTFEPLMASASLLSEAHAMQNCADQYAERLARDKCRLFSVKRRGQRLATLEIGPHPREASVLAITQLKARHNLPASMEIWRAAYAWLASQSELRRPYGSAAPRAATARRQLDKSFGALSRGNQGG